MQEKLNAENVTQDIYKSNPTADLESAVKTGDVETLFSIIAKIDRTITKAYSGTFSPTSPDASGPLVKQEMQDFLDKFKKDPERALLRIFLGDAGCSRLMLRGTEDGNLDVDLSPVSSAAAKAKWAELISEYI